MESRPNRSDTHVPVEEEARMEAETRQHFEELAPTRHSKPQRSDHSSAYLDTAPAQNAIPEYDHFQRLESDHHQQKLVYSSAQAAEEFVETDYYQDLNSVDKQHHTTGTGFIKEEVQKNGGDEHHEEGCYSNVAAPCCSGNPATNEWIPSAADTQLPDSASTKPSRSDI